jgi:dihydroflavonol-4-reductase
VLIRSTSPCGNIEGLDVDRVVGDLSDTASLARAMVGVRYLFHVAADYRLWVRNTEDMFKPNVDGTRNIMKAALNAGVERIVYTSSVATLAMRENGEPSDETVSLDPGKAMGTYKQTKVIAERVVTSLVAKNKLAAVIVNPTTPIGPRDIRPTPTGRIIIEAACGRIPGFVDTGLNIVHVDDVATGHLQAMHRGRIGERYILGGQNVSFREFVGAISEMVGRPPPPALRIPRSLLFPAALLSEAICRLTNHEPFLTRDGLRMAEHQMYFSTAKAERELGYRARPYKEAIGEAVEWFKARGHLH